MENTIQDVSSGLDQTQINQNSVPAGSTPSLSGQTQPFGVPTNPEPSERRWVFIIIVALLVLGVIGILAALLLRPEQPIQINNRFETIQIPLDEFLSGEGLALLGTHNLNINGRLQVNDAFIISPSTQPTNGTSGQIYYDQTSNELAYFNGDEFISLPGDVTTGNGITNVDGQLNNTGVLTVQGQAGNVSLTSGSGIAIDGTTLTNTGMLSLGGATGDITLGSGLTMNNNQLRNTGVNSLATGTANLVITNDGAGNLTISDVGGGSGTVTSSGGTAGRIAKFTGLQNIEDSLLSESGSAITVNGDLTVTGATSLTNPLTVGNGGTGATSLANNGVVISHGAGAFTSVASGVAGQCLLSTVGAPAWGACPGGSGVVSLDGLTGALILANSTGAGTTITIDDASTTQKGIAQFNATNFSVGTGLVNTVQDIHTGASPTFTNLTLNGDIAVNGGDLTSTGALTLTPGGTFIVGADGQNVTLRGAVTTITSSGAGNDVIINSADTILLQDNTSVAGNLTVTGTAPEALVVKASTNGSSSIVMNILQSDDDSIMRLTDNGTLAVGNNLGIAGILALGNGAGGDFAEIRTNITTSTIYELPEVGGGTVSFCTSGGNCGATTGTLQAAYGYSTGGTTPEIKLDTIRNGIEIQDANSTIGSGQNFLSLRGPNASGLGNVLVGFGTEGNLFMQPSVDRVDLVDINTTGGANLLTVDSINSRVGIALGGSVTPTVSLDVGGNTNLRGTNTGDALTVSNASSTGNVLVLKDGATNVATVADGGLTTFQNSTNSASAFRVLNSAGTTNELLGVDTSDSILRLLSNNSGHLSGTSTNWNSSTTLPATRFAGAAVTINGYLYHIGGCDSGSNRTATVYYARTNSDGSTGTWAATTSIPQAMCGGAATTYNGFIYVNGGTGASATSRDVYYAKPNPDGSITSWTTQDDPTNYTVGLQDNGVAAFNGHLYITAGTTDDGLATRNRTVYYARINSDGSVPTFTAQTNWLPNNDFNAGQTIIANGYLYVFGTSSYNTFYYGKLKSDASVGNFDGSTAVATAITGSTDARKYSAIAVMNGYMYVIGGGLNAASQNTVQYGAFTSTGDITSFSAVDTTTLPARRWLSTKIAPTVNNYIYFIGGADQVDAATNTTYYAGGTRVKVGGALDLTGYTGESGTEGGSGGQLTAGNTLVNGSFSVTGNTNLKDGASIGNNLSVTGLSSFQSTTNSTTAFQMINASSVPQFVIDTTNGRTYIGNPTADTTGALLVLDTKNNAGDPTGVDGGMYYNSLARTFRCYENSVWVECIGIPKPNTQRTTHMVANGDTENWTGYGDILTNVAPGGSGGALSNNAVPSVYNDTIASAGSVAGVFGNTIYSGSRITFQTHLDQPIQTNVRVWTGLTTESLATMGGSATPTGEFASFRYDLGAGDSTWKCITRDGSSATTVDSGVTIASDQKFEIVLDNGVRAVFKINGQTVCNITTTLPPDTFLRVFNSITALNADSKTLYSGWIYVEGDPTPQ